MGGGILGISVGRTLLMARCHVLMLCLLTLLHPVDEAPEHAHLAPLGDGHVLPQLQLGGSAGYVGAGEGDGP